MKKYIDDMVEPNKSDSTYPKLPKTETERMAYYRFETSTISRELHDRFERLKYTTNPIATTEFLFDSILKGVASRDFHLFVCKKCVCVDAREVTPEEVGQEHIVWSHGQVEKKLIKQLGMTLITTLDETGKPIVDKLGHENVYDMATEKFNKKYKPFGKHYIQEDKAGQQVKIAIVIPDAFIPENGLKLLPPNWGGYEGTLMRGGIVMLPFDSEKRWIDQLTAWEQAGCHKIDWYPNNEATTYAPCDSNGTFENENLRKMFQQTSEYEGYPYSKKLEDKKPYFNVK